MVFSSNIFLFGFFPLFLVLYFLTPRRFGNLCLFVVSTLFYFWASGPLVIWLLLCVVLNYYAGKGIACSPNGRARWILGGALAFDLGLLLYYKYFSFFRDQFCNLLGLFHIQSQFAWQVALPLGISFFVFKAMSYPIEVYRQVVRPADKLIDFGAYLTLFPQLMAGPIARFSETCEDLRHRTPSGELFFSGLQRFAFGLGKKVLIANSLAPIADKTFSMTPDELTTPLAWLGLLCYSFQIYYDFSGYSDMAIGIGQFLGFQFPENFNQPYRARNITEFWRRWHITLSNWLRDFLFLPLEYKLARFGQLRPTDSGRVRRLWTLLWRAVVRSSWRTSFNLLVVFSLCGFWHGAAWTFLVWGMIHGFWLAVELELKRRFKWQSSGIPGILFTYFLVMMGWVFFRAKSCTAALNYLEALWGMHLGAPRFVFFPVRFYLKNSVIFYLGCATLFAWLPVEKFQKKEFCSSTLATCGVGAVSLFLIIYSAVVLSTVGFNPFIYFRF
jgi:alginate O-acetyltransferase complex protein AlgI